MIKNIAVFCGSHLAHNPHFEEAARQTGTLIATQGRKLYYGGSNKGYMGVVSSAALEQGGHVVGIIPTLFSKEIIYSQAVTELILVTTMAERKQRLAELSDAFIALPGGIGTLDEATEMLTNNQLSLFRKPMAFLNIDGFYNPFLQQIDSMCNAGLLEPQHRATILSATTPEELLCLIDAFK